MLDDMGVHIIGTGRTRLGRLGRPAGSLALEAARVALEDAGLGPKDLGLVVVANALGFVQGQGMVRGQTWLRQMGLGSVPVVNVENACGSGLAAVAVGRMAVIGGDGPALVVGIEVMCDDREAVGAGLLHGVAEGDRASYVGVAAGAPPLVAVNARWARDLLDQGRVTLGQITAVAVKAYANAAVNPDAQHRRARTAEEIRMSPVVVEPLTRLMCSSFTDGAAAMVLKSGPSFAPRLRSVSMISGDGSGDRELRLEQASSRALDAAGVGPSDLDLVELHDASAAEELLALEAMGIFARGEAGPATERGETSRGGRSLAVNPSGGLIGRGHPIGATGVFQLSEVADQVSGRAGACQVQGARLGLVSNLGGFIGADLAFAGSAVIEAGERRQV